MEEIRWKKKPWLKWRSVLCSSSFSTLSNIYMCKLKFFFVKREMAHNLFRETFTEAIK